MFYSWIIQLCGVMILSEVYLKQFLTYFLQTITSSKDFLFRMQIMVE